MIKVVRRLSFNKAIKASTLVVNRPIPIVEQVTEIIRNRIRDGVYSAMERIPSEAELSMSLKVSRATVRTALTTLAAEDLIIRRQGDGTYVNTRVMEVLSQSRWEFTQLIEDSGRKPSIVQLNTFEGPASLKIATLLDIKPDEAVITAVRLFKADDLPVIYSINILPKSLIRVPFPWGSLDIPLTDFLEKYCEERYVYNIVSISASQVDSEISQALNIDQGLPIIKLEEIFYNSNRQPLFCATNYCNDRMIRIRFSLQKNV